MKIKIQFLVFNLIINLMNLNLYSQNTGFLKIGNDYLTNNKYEITRNGKYSLSHSGLSVGFLLPIRIKHISSFYKVEVTLHKVTDIKNPDQYNWYNRTLYNKHISGLNELLIGKCIYISDKSSILPQIGFGFQMESLFRNSPRESYESIIYSAIILDFALSYIISSNKCFYGVMLNYSNAITKSTFVYDATDRVGFSLILGI